MKPEDAKRQMEILIKERKAIVERRKLDLRMNMLKIQSLRLDCEHELNDKGDCSVCGGKASE